MFAWARHTFHYDLGANAMTEDVTMDPKDPEHVAILTAWLEAVCPEALQLPRAEREKAIIDLLTVFNAITPEEWALPDTERSKIIDNMLAMEKLK
jgi:hypothetical protein